MVGFAEQESGVVVLCEFTVLSLTSTIYPHTKSHAINLL
jgi:hypothetical protein